MESILNHLEDERKNWDFFLTIPDVDRAKVKADSVKGSQLLLPLFEFSGACAACGETPYIKLITQFYGDRMLIGNATGCSSIYGGNMPTTPYSVNKDGRGPTWCNSLFEDNAEFALGFRMAIDKQKEFATELLNKKRDKIGAGLVDNILNNKQETEAEIAQQRAWVADLKKKVEGTACDCSSDKILLSIADSLVRKSVWAFGGDGWAYDIGYGGLDHVIAVGKDVNLLVMDTEVYSNTGGQASKSTPKGAVAKFAAGGKPTKKKDLGLMGIAYGNVFVAQIAMGSPKHQKHAIDAIRAAESYPGASMLIAYSHCRDHIIDMKLGLEIQKEAVETGFWPLYTYDPRNKQPMQLISDAPTGSLKAFMEKQGRFTSLKRANPEQFEKLAAAAQAEALEKYEFYKAIASVGR
jgi:pyruvate-ferredoxin/flavodoxin oxidoreductase